MFQRPTFEKLFIGGAIDPLKGSSNLQLCAKFCVCVPMNILGGREALLRYMILREANDLLPRNPEI